MASTRHCPNSTFETYDWLVFNKFATASWVSPTSLRAKRNFWAMI
jgi:hypothetical protein